MIQPQTLLKIVDNSGAKTARCIKVLGGSRKRSASVGDIIVVAVQQVRSRGKYKAKVKKALNIKESFFTFYSNIIRLISFPIFFL